MTDIEYIASKLSKEDILCQLAEEAAELAQAALKLRRAITGTNPTPVSADDAKHALNEEIVDVAAAIEVYFASISDNYRQREELEDLVDCIAKNKEKRWAQRLKDTANTNCAAVAPTDTPTDTPTAGVKTRQEKFLEVFPKVRTDTDGTITFCPGSVKPDFDCPNKSWDYYSVDCRECRKKYWLAAEKEDGHD